MFQVDSPLVIMRGGGRNLAYQHPESLLPGLSNQVVRFIDETTTVPIKDFRNDQHTLQVSVRFWPGLWRGSEGVASREELLLVMRDVEQVELRTCP